MSAQDPLLSYLDNLGTGTGGDSSAGGGLIWYPTDGTTTDGTTTTTGGTSSPGGTTTPSGGTGTSSQFPWKQAIGVGASALGALLNYLATAQRNNLLKQQIANNNALIQADQARRDYYSSILMPSMLGAMNITNPQTLQRAQAALNQSNFPGPLTASSTGVLTSGAPATTTGTAGTTGTTGTTAGTTPTLSAPPFRRPMPTGLLTQNTPTTGAPTTGSTAQAGNYVPGIFSGADASMGPGTYPYQPTNPNGLPVI